MRSGTTVSTSRSLSGQSFFEGLERLFEGFSIRRISLKECARITRFCSLGFAIMLIHAVKLGSLRELSYLFHPTRNDYDGFSFMLLAAIFFFLSLVFMLMDRNNRGGRESSLYDLDLCRDNSADGCSFTSLASAVRLCYIITRWVLREVSMKKIVLIMVVLALMLSLALPQRAQAHGGGWWVPGAFFGGLLFGTAIARPWYYPSATRVRLSTAEHRAYAYPPPAYAYPPQPQGYIYQNPALPLHPGPRRRGLQAPHNAPGEWVTVPGQWVGDKYVPSHKAWVPAK